MVYGETSGEDLSTKAWAFSAVCRAPTTFEGDVNRQQGETQIKTFEKTFKSKHQ